MMKLRDKLSRKRNVLLVDEEKPFLEHLDDLRKMVMRVVLTLLVAVTLCFVFNKWFFEVVKYPLVRAGLSSAQERNLPAGLGLEQWQQVHMAARGASVLDDAGRELFFSTAVPDVNLRNYAEALLIYHVADLLPKEKQTAYMEAAVKLRKERQAEVLEAGKALLLARPRSSLEALRPLIEMTTLAPAEGFMLSMKLSMFAGIIVSFPLLFYFLLEFILPGLNPREKRLLWPTLAVGFGLFLLGVFFAYYFVVPKALEFFHDYSASLGVQDGWRIGNYISFVTSFCLIFGVSFELPVVVMVLVKLELLTSTTMRRTRSWAIIIITTASAILTPTPDVVTLSFLAVPMILMYEGCIWAAVALERKRDREEAEESSRDMARRAALVGVASVGAAARPGSAGADDRAEGADGSPSGLDAGVDVPLPGVDADGPDGHGDLPGHHDDPYHKDDHWQGHPHHPDPEKPTPDEEYEQYMREHAHLFPSSQTHPEETPVEERGESGIPANTDASVEGAPSDESAGSDSAEDKPSADPENGDPNPDDAGGGASGHPPAP